MTTMLAILEILKFIQESQLLGFRYGINDSHIQACT